MPWTLLLNPRVIGALVFVVACVGIVSGAYFKGKSVERVKWELATQKARADAEKVAKETEERQTAELSKVSENYEAKLNEVHGNYGAWVDNLRLRVATSDKHLSKVTAAARESNARTAAGCNGQIELNRERIGEIAASIGQDLDACREQVIGLQGVINGYLDKQ